MPYNLRNRSFLKLLDFSKRDLNHILNLARDLKRAKYAGNEVQRLRGKNIALIFEKSSTRTRTSFEVASFDQGAHVTNGVCRASAFGDTGCKLGRVVQNHRPTISNLEKDLHNLVHVHITVVQKGLLELRQRRSDVARRRLRGKFAQRKIFSEIAVRCNGRLRLCCANVRPPV